MIKSTIKGVGFYVPDNVVTNDDLAKLMTTNDEWITERTGIKERRHRPLNIAELPTGTMLAIFRTKRAFVIFRGTIPRRAKGRKRQIE